MTMDGSTGFSIKTLKGESTHGLENLQLSVFEQPLWRNWVSQTDGYREEVAFRGGVPVARLPYTLKRESYVGISWGLCPPLSCRNGPTFDPALTAAEKADALALLIGSAQRHHPLTSFVFTCDSASPEAPLVREQFVRAGFQHLQPINPVLHPHQPSLMTPLATDASAINKRRSHIRNARGKLEIVEEMKLDDFLAFYSANLLARGKTKSFLDSSLARSLFSEGIAKQQVRLMAARQKRRTPDEAPGPVDAAIALAWDNPLGSSPLSPDAGSDEVPPSDRCYLLLLAFRAPSAEESKDKPVADASKVLIMEAADFAARHNLIFDTGGWATTGGRRFYQQLFPRKDSEEHLDVFRSVRRHADWYERNKNAFKEVAAQHGITQIRFSAYNAKIVWRKFIQPLIWNGRTSAAPL